MTFPSAEVGADSELVRQLLERDCPGLAHLGIRLAGEGWDNYIFALSDQAHAVRLPRRSVAAVLLANEQKWLPGIAARLPVPVPLPVHTGLPGELFPFHWSVVRWVTGTTADVHSFSATDVSLLAKTLTALHQPAPDGAPRNSFRGVPLPERDIRLRELLDRRAASREEIARYRAVWDEACAAREVDDHRWLHGDLHALNVVIRDGAFAGIIDWGDLTAGDVATDLAAAWLLLDDPVRRRQLLDTYMASPLLRQRSRGWALYIALVLAESGEPTHRTLGERVIARVLYDPE